MARPWGDRDGRRPGPGEAGGDLTADETAYLDAYYDRLATSGAVPRLEGLAQGASTDPAATHRTLSTVANGLMALSQADGGAHVPASVHALLAQRIGGSGIAAFTGDPIRTRVKTADGWYVPGLAEYSGTAGLLEHATVDGGAEFTTALGESALRAKQDINSATNGAPDLRAEAEAAPNALLDVVARDAEASQAIIGNTANRDVLLGADWIDGSGAAAVLTTATAPAQATEELAEESARLSSTLFRDLGSDPAGWREAIPKGSDVSDAVTALAASRIDSFAYPARSTDFLQEAEPNPDGTYTAGVRLGGDRTEIGGDTRGDFLKFVATGTDLTDPLGDPDIQRIRAAADVHVVDNLAEALRTGTGVTEPLRHAGDLDGAITRSQFEALVDQGIAADTAAAAAHADATRAATLGIAVITGAERLGAATAVGGLSSPLNSQIKDPFNVAFDAALAQVLPLPAAPEPQTPGRIADYLDATNQDYLTHRAHLIVAAKHEAGLIDPAAYPTLFTPEGTLRPIQDGFVPVPLGQPPVNGLFQTPVQGILNQPGDPLGDLDNLARDIPPGMEEWSSALSGSGEARAGYDPGVYPGEPDPATPIDDPDTLYRLRYGTP